MGKILDVFLEGKKDKEKEEIIKSFYSETPGGDRSIADGKVAIVIPSNMIKFMGWKVQRGRAEKLVYLDDLSLPELKKLYRIKVRKIPPSIKKGKPKEKEWFKIDELKEVYFYKKITDVPGMKKSVSFEGGDGATKSMYLNFRKFYTGGGEGIFISTIRGKKFGPAILVNVGKISYDIPLKDTWKEINWWLRHKELWKEFFGSGKPVFVQRSSPNTSGYSYLKSGMERIVPNIRTSFGIKYPRIFLIHKIGSSEFLDGKLYNYTVGEPLEILTGPEEKETVSLIGETWKDGKGRKREVVGKKKKRGVWYVEIRTGEKKTKSFIPMNKLEAEIKKDTLEFKLWKKKQKEEKDKMPFLDEFTRGMSKSKKSKALLVLKKELPSPTPSMYGNESLAYNISRLISKANISIKGKGKKRELVSPGGIPIPQKRITKIGMDYAEFLIKKKYKGKRK